MGPSPGALALTMLAWGSQEEPTRVGPSPGALTMLTWGSQGLGPQEEPKRGRTPEEVVSTHIQYCLATW